MDTTPRHLLQRFTNSMHLATHALPICALLAANGDALEPYAPERNDVVESDMSRSLLADWNIQPLGVNADFGEESQVKLEYNISTKGEPRVTIITLPYDDPDDLGGNKTCSNSSQIAEVEFTQTVTPVSDDVENLLVGADINFTTVENSNVYHYVNNSFGYITFCVTVELWIVSLAMNMSVSSNTQMVELTSSKVASNADELEEDDEGGGYVITIGDTSGGGGSTVLQDSSLELSVIACVCNDNNECIEPTPTLSQNSALKICLESEYNSFEIKELVSLDIKQNDEIKFSPVTGGEDNLITNTRMYDGQNGNQGVSVSTRLISSLFEAVNPPPINVVGQVDLSFATSRRMRDLEEANSDEEHTRRAEEKELLSAFDLEINLASVELGDIEDRDDVVQGGIISNDAEEESGSISGSAIEKSTTVTIIVCSSLLVVVALVSWFGPSELKRRRLAQEWKDTEYGLVMK